MPGRIFVFDQWHLFLTAIELYRLQKVDLVIVYVRSVDKNVLKLIEQYALKGIVEIRFGISCI